ncbi:MAG TPA: sigma-70 family RNA polymerase sigma factor [Bacteroidales bacterium]|nr:sigma-70 family RNA polymerase sigma factor [Bacteroidales bacterium]
MVFRIASNNCIDFLRKRKTITVSIDENFEKDEYEYSFNIESSDLNPEENFIKSQNSVLLAEIVKKMKPRYRELIELRYFKEFAYEEIAQHMNLPLGTVKAQLFRARELLYNVLQRTH